MSEREPPSGTVTFLFTDIESSTWLLQHLGDDYDRVLHDHNRLLREVWAANDGYEVSTEGDAFFVTFDDPSKAVRAARDAQLALLQHPWPQDGAVQVRMGVHTGEARVYGTDYIGLDVHRAARIASAAHGGQVIVSDATRSAAAVDDVSFTDLGPHRLKDLAQAMRLYQVTGPGLGTDFPPPRTLTVMPNNFPIQLTTFVGRDDDVAGVREAVASSRLVTLTGAGGVGKTRLALQVGAELLDDFRDGAWWIDLAPLIDPQLVTKAVADALGVREQPARTLADTLTDALPAKELLLVLDNCEHLIDACAAFVHGTLASCPRVRVLATSREALNVTGETAWRLRSLGLPDGSVDLAAVARAEAVRLFVQRVRSSRSDFELDERNAPCVIQICRRLDGLPLAIELAAARVRTVSVQDVAARLDDRFRLLVGGSRVALPRQRTLEATVSWSYDLLSEDERLLFGRLSLFLGGCTLDAAERVCADDNLDAAAVLDLLSSLVDRSLVIADTDAGGGTRYRMLETLRQFGRDRLLERGGVTELRDRHLAWAVGWAERPGGAFDRLAWISDPDEANLYAAVEWASERGDLASALRILVSAWLGHFVVRRRWFDELLPRVEGSVPPDVLALAYRTAGGLDFMTGRWRTGAERMRLGVEAYEAVGDEVGRAWCAIYEAVCVGADGEETASERMLEAILAQVQGFEDRGPHARTLLALTWLESDRDLVRAEALALEGVEVSLSLEAPFDRAHAWEVLGYIRSLLGKREEAAGMLRDALRALAEAKIPTCGSHCLETAAAWMVMGGRFEEGAELVGTAARIREETGDVPRPWERIVHERWLPKIREELGAASYAEAYGRGEARTFEEAVAFAERSLGD